MYNFRNFVLQNFPYLEDDFDALTDYELFCKMIEYVKTLVKDNEDFRKQLEELENYVYNLNLQDEVNNKLDEMAQDGTLENLIGQYIQLATTYVYNTVAEMKTATNLVDGSFMRTSGFYSYKDGGGALYKARTLINTDTVDEITLIALNDENLVAELIIEETMNFKQFGAKGDGENDDTENIQLCLNKCKNVLVNGGTYMINTSTGVIPKSNSYIKLINATLKAITSSAGQYNVVRFEDENNITLDGGTIEGDRTTHTGETGEWGHCIRLESGNNITIKNIILKNGWGDGLYIHNGSNIKTQNVICDNNRRQGISIISVDGYHSLNDEVKNTNGTAPQSGIDIEPNDTTDVIKNIIIDNLYSHDNVGNGIDIVLSELGSSGYANIVINNPKIEKCSKAINGGYPAGVKGEIIINNLYAHDISTYGVDIAARYSNGGLILKLLNPYIDLFNTSNGSGNCGISFGAGDSEWGNIIIENPYVDTIADYQDNSRSINFGGYTGTTAHHPVNCMLINPRYLFNNVIKTAYGENIKIIDTLEIMTINSFENNYLVQSQNEVCSVITNKNNIENAYCAMRPYTAIGQDTKCIRLSDYTMRVKIPSGHYCKSLSSSAGIYIGLTNVGDSITLRRISDTEWIVVNMVGTPTIS